MIDMFIMEYCLLKKLLNKVPFNIGAHRWQIHPSIFA
jgi:hypothetical protein